MSDRAQRFYALQGQKDVQSALDNALTLIGWVYQLSEMVYHLGALSRAWCDQMVADSEHQLTPSSRLLCPAAAPVALLPAAQPTTIRLPGSLASSGVAIVTPAPKIDQEPPQINAIECVSQPMGAETVALPQSASSGMAIIPPAPVNDALVPEVAIEVAPPASDAETVAPAVQQKTPTKPSQHRPTAKQPSKPTTTKSQKKSAKA